MRSPVLASTYQCASCGAYLEPDRKWSLSVGILGFMVGTWLYGNFNWLKLLVAVAFFLGLGIVFGFGQWRFRVQGRAKGNQ